MYTGEGGGRMYMDGMGEGMGVYAPSFHPQDPLDQYAEDEYAWDVAAVVERERLVERERRVEREREASVSSGLP